MYKYRHSVGQYVRSGAGSLVAWSPTQVLVLVHVVSNLPHEVVCLVVCWCQKVWCISKERFLFWFKQRPGRKPGVDHSRSMFQAASGLCHASSWSRMCITTDNTHMYILPGVLLHVTEVGVVCSSQ